MEGFRNSCYAFMLVWCHVARFMDLSIICEFLGQKIVCGWIKAKCDFVQLRLSISFKIVSHSIK